jgi:hypothetical protein
MTNRCDRPQVPSEQRGRQPTSRQHCSTCTMAHDATQIELRDGSVQREPSPGESPACGDDGSRRQVLSTPSARRSRPLSTFASRGVASLHEFQETRGAEHRRNSTYRRTPPAIESWAGCSVPTIFEVYRWATRDVEVVSIEAVKVIAPDLGDASSRQGEPCTKIDRHSRGLCLLRDRPRSRSQRRHREYVPLPSDGARRHLSDAACQGRVGLSI